MPRFGPHPDRRPAVVTGASSGIGEAIARALAAAGHPVALGARRAERCERIAGEIVAAGGAAVGLRLDVTDAGSVKDFVAAAESALGPIEVLVSNAGESLPGTGLDTAPDEFARRLDVNLQGAHRLAGALGPAMVERARGDIVFVTTEAARSAWPGVAAYVAAKSGLEALARAMQMELEGSGVRVSIVRPGSTLTEMGTDWDPAAVAPTLERFRRFGVIRHPGLLKPEQVARVVVDVVSMPRGSHVTLVEVQPEAPAPTRGDST